ncbi:MAG: beta-N-acetylhexosaminidase [Verrucomicrobia bacterium]|nr:beta-N-acetylhexosaminidase [Verrucomicrobiota bacterium]
MGVIGGGMVMMACNSGAVAVVPQPTEINETGGTLELNSTAVIAYADTAAKNPAEMLAASLRPATGFKLPVKPGTQGTIVFRTTEDSKLGSEGYELCVTDHVSITAPTEQGLFYGAQTLRQLLPVGIFSPKKVSAEWMISGVEIRDVPRFGWRGMHLDVGRHFFAVDDIKKFIDLLSIHKLNTFHWHLTEDQGWRVEIKKYPKLTTVGAYRASTPPYGNRGGSDGKRYGGFYTQDEIRGIVAYAAERHITIVPEIDMPGHMAAAVASYPEIGNTDISGYNPKVETHWGVHPYILAPSEESFRFVEDVLAEICELFPSKYIHIGGDEAPKGQWKKSKIAQEVIQREGLHNEHELQSYFIQRVEKILEKQGRLLIGWDEIREGGLSPQATVMSWRGVKGGIASAKEGHDVIMAPNSHTYFDHYQNDPKAELAKGTEFECIGGLLPIQKVYSFDPVLPSTLSAKEQKHVLGVQAQLWTEYMKTWDKVEYLAFPRVAALAEVAWTSSERKDFAGFAERLESMRGRYRAMGVNAYDGELPKPPRSLAGTCIESSLPHYQNHVPQYAHDGKADTFFWSSLAPGKDDHITLSFDQPLASSAKVSVSTGGEGAQSADRLENGRLEVYRDGKQGERIATFKDGKAVGTAPAGTKQICIISNASQDKWLIVREIAVDVD